MFVDQAEIFVQSGAGGAGCVSFRRERFVPRGGPDGGDGGHGGSVFLEAVPGLDTLSELAGRHHWRAKRGHHGQGKNMTGKKGQDLIVPVPVGTLVYDRDLGILLQDLTRPGQQVCVAAGGKGGKGNSAFATSTEQTPRYAQPGTEAQQRWLRLELKLIADVGFVGMPNAGKSTLLSRLSAARPKIADYAFTTLSPQLGIVELSDYRRLVMADLPGLIEGAHQGHGLGDAFLRHIERTRIIVHLLDIYPPADAEPAENYRTIRRELTSYSEKLAAKPELIVANKMDLTDSDQALIKLRRELNTEVIGISAVAGTGLRQLLEKLWDMIADLPDEDRGDRT
ncbi:MAG: GTPase ObgE [Actinobacteria bacterium]|nr:GTPase ObgE [Actinomycetota bacterium]